MELSFKHKGKKYVFTAPDRLEDMTPKQWLAWHKCLHLVGSRMMLFEVIWGMKVQDVDLLEDEMKAEILFLTEQLEHIEVLPNKWMMPELFGFVGPDDLLTNLCFEEWMYADKFCENFLETGNMIDGRKFLAAIYREKVSEQDYLVSGDRRVGFRKNDIDVRVSKFLKADYATIRAVANNWIGCKQEFKNVFPYVFRGNDEQVDAVKKNFSWLDVGLSMVEDNPIDFLQLEKTSFFLVLKALDSKLEKDKRMSEKIEEQRKKRNK